METATSAEGPQPGKVLILNFRAIREIKIEYLHYSAAPSHCKKIHLSLVLCKSGRRNNLLPEGNPLKLQTPNDTNFLYLCLFPKQFNKKHQILQRRP